MVDYPKSHPLHCQSPTLQEPLKYHTSLALVARSRSSSFHLLSSSFPLVYCIFKLVFIWHYSIVHSIVSVADMVTSCLVASG